MDFGCIHEVRWKEEGTKVLRTAMSMHKIFWIGGENAQSGLGILVTEH